MRKWIIATIFILMSTQVFAAGIQPGLIQVREADGSPAGWVKSITVTNGALSISGADATISLTPGAGQPVVLDLGNGGAPYDSADLGMIATTGDTNSIFTEPSPDKLLIDVSKNWPTADVANAGDSATAFFSSGTIEAARLPVPSATSGGIAPTTSGHADGQVLTVQADGSAEWEAVTASGTGDVSAASNLTTLALVQGDDGAKGVKTSAITLDANSNITIGGGAQASQTITGAVTGTDPVITFSNGVVNISTGALQAGGYAVLTTNTSNISAANLAATLTFSDGDLIDLSAITQSSDTNEGFILPTWANVTTTGVTNGAIAWDETSKALKVKSASGWQSIGATAAPVDPTYLTLNTNATLTNERVLTEGTAIDFVDGGANSTLTINFDSTELGTTTWGSGSAIVWTFDASGGTDPTMTFGNNLITLASGLTVTTGKNISLGAVQWNSGDNIDGTKVANADLGDITVSSGVWSVEDDSHAHTSTTLPATTVYTDSTGITMGGAAVAFGDADTDALTIRSMVKGGNSREVQINAGARTAPTYPSATPTQDLYVKGNLEIGGIGYASAWQATGTGESYIDLTSNASTPVGAGSNSLYVVSNAWKVAENGTEKDLVTADNSVTWTGATQNFSGVTNMILPTATPDATGEVGIIAGNIFAYHDGAAVIKIDTTGIADGKILKWVAANGAFEVADDATAGSPTLDTIGDPSGDTTIEMQATEEVNFDYTGNFTAGSQFRIRQVTGNPSGGVLFEVIGTDTDITLVKMGDGTNGVTVSATGAMTAAGTGTIVATGLTAGTAPVPATAGGVALGSATAEWDHLYLHDSAVIYGQADQSNTLTSAATGWTANLLFSGNAGLAAGNGATGAGFLRLKEDSDNGTDYSTITGAADAGASPAFVFGGSAANSESITLTMGSNDNTATVSTTTGVTSLSFSAINLVTTGTISGALPINSDANGMSQGEMTTAGMYGTVFFATGAGTWNLPAAAAGMSILVYSTTAAAIVINPDNSDVIVLNGTALSAGDSITSASGAGDYIALVAIDATTWYTIGRSGTWTDTN
jgi:hypothetical protein